MTRAAMIIVLLCLTGCKAPIAKHQQGGHAYQSLGRATAHAGMQALPPSATGLPADAPVQMLQQPENPEGASVQAITRTTTTTQPDGSVITTTERAETTVGGSQDLAKILKEYLGAEYIKRLSIALIMAIIAFKVRREWPIVAGVLAIGALIVAFFGLTYVFAVGGAAGGLFVAYYVVRAQLHPIP